MRRIEMTKLQARVLGLNLEIKPQGFSHRELRVLEQIQLKIDEALGTYQERLDGAVAEARGLAREARRQHAGNAPVLQQALAAIAQAQNDEVEELNERYGREQVTLMLHDLEYRLASEAFGAIESFSGAREARRAIIAITDALSRADVATTEQGNGRDHDTRRLQPVAASQD